MTLRQIYLLAGATVLLTACADKPPAQVAVETAPAWYLKPPVDDGVLYVTGMSVSGDLQFAIDKATLSATAALADRLKGETSVLMKSHVSERGHITVSSNEKTVKKTAKAETAGYEVEDTAVVPLGTQFRVFVLVKYTPAVDEDNDKAFQELDKETAPVAPAAPIAPSEPPPPAADPKPRVQAEPI